MKTVICKIIIFLLPLILVGVSGCSDDDKPVQPPEEGPVGRTVLVYMVATNDLGSSGYDKINIDQMLQSARDGGITDGRLLVYHASATADPVLFEVTATGKSVLVEYDDDTPSVHSSRMLEVLGDVKRIAPAKSYGIVLWSHATGWIENGIEDDGGLEPLSFGVDRSKRMNVTTLARTLRGQGLQFIYFDCCYMGGVEVMYELRDVCSDIVASPSELPARGMRYDLNVPLMFKPVPDYAGMCRNTYEVYDALSEPVDRTCTMVWVRTAGMSRLAAAVRDIYATCTARPWNEIDGLQVYTDPVQYNRHYYADLKHYIESFGASDSQLAEFDAALAEVVGAEYHTDYIWHATPLIHVCGLSTFAPATEGLNVQNYHNLAWWTDVADALHF